DRQKKMYHLVFLLFQWYHFISGRCTAPVYFQPFSITFSAKRKGGGPMLSPCNTTVDGTNRELLAHGTGAFPVGCYHDDLCRGEVVWHWHEELEAAVVSEGSVAVTIGG